MSESLEIPDGILSSARLSKEDAVVELALALYRSRRLSIGKARELASMSLWEFRQLSASRGITADIDVEDFDDEMATLKRLGRL